MTPKSIEDRLREEYSFRLDAIRKVCFEVEARARHCLLPVMRTLKRHEKIVVTSRIKDCESAILSLERRQQWNQFDRDRATPYLITELKDLAGVRVGVFPRSRVSELDVLLRDEFPGWSAKHVPDRRPGGHPPLAYKYHGMCESDSEVGGEYQVMPLMTALYWEVQHAAIYKGDGRIRPKMEVREAAVLEAMRQFEEEFERLLLQEQSLHSPE